MTDARQSTMTGTGSNESRQRVRQPTLLQRLRVSTFSRTSKRNRASSASDGCAGMGSTVSASSEDQWNSNEEPSSPQSPSPNPWSRQASTGSTDLREFAAKVQPREEWDLSADVLKRALQSGEAQLTFEQVQDQIEMESVCMVEAMRLGRTSSSSYRISGRKSTLGAGTMACTCLDRLRLLRGPGLPLNPHSRVRLAWDLMSILTLLMEAVAVPLLMFVLPEGFRFTVPLEWHVNIFWSLDIFLSFITSTYVNFELKTEFKDIAKHYARTWLVLDLVMVLPEWIWFLTNLGARSGLSSLRFLKAIRAVRLLRLLKLETRFREQLKRVNSVSNLNWMSLFQMVVGLLVFNHIFACAWYSLGKHSEAGWLRLHLQHSGEEGDPLINGYLLALHWSLTQFHGSSVIGPGNMTERVFAISMLVIGLVTFSMFVSITTDMILQVRQVRKRRFEQTQNMRDFFLRHRVSMELMVSVKSYMDLVMSDEREWVDDREVLKGLPLSLQKSVLLEARKPIFEAHALFHWLTTEHTSAFRDLCQSGFSGIHAVAGTAFFEGGDSWESMVFVEWGHCRYNPRMRVQSNQTMVAQRSMTRDHFRMHVGKRIAPNAWLCELALWVQGWQGRGDFVATSNSSALCLTSKSLIAVLKNFPPAHMDVAMYGSWVLKQVSMELPSKIDDLWMADIHDIPCR